MKHVAAVVLALSGLLFVAPHSHSESKPQEACVCAELACDPCAVKKSETFYTAKCGAQKKGQSSKIVSCKRPTCIAIDQTTEKCPVLPTADSKSRAPITIKEGTAVPTDAPKASVAPAASVTDTAAAPAAPAAKPAATPPGPTVGKVRVISGSISIVNADGQKTEITNDTDLREHQKVETGKDGKAVVEFDGGNKLHVHPDSAVEVQEFKGQNTASRKALLNLIKGRVRNQVKQKYDGKNSYYQVRTRAAVAGVRGTDFVVEHLEDVKMETRVSAFEGKVLLASLDERQTREILAGEGAKFSADMPDPSFKDADLSDFIERGTLSPVYQIEPAELKALDTQTKFDVAKAKIKKGPKPESAICERPRGFLDNCYWTCTGNPKGSTKCMVSQPGVTCTRARCNANGQWSEITPLPAATSSGVCPPEGFTVKACDY